MDVTDKGDKIEFSLWMSKVGDFGDLAEFTAWAQPIYAKYDHDRRPQVHTSPNWSESMTVLDNGKHFVAQVGKGKGS